MVRVPVRALPVFFEAVSVMSAGVGEEVPDSGVTVSQSSPSLTTVQLRLQRICRAAGASGTSGNSIVLFLPKPVTVSSGSSR